MHTTYMSMHASPLHLVQSPCSVAALRVACTGARVFQGKSCARIARDAQDDYAGLHLDGALRNLLREFKLPGEAQQIDRIMEKFADTYCRQNADTFRRAEDAYRLAFATIMLNTDMHNPLAERMLSLETFVEMNSDPDEEGQPVPVLPAEELTGVYERISSNVRPLHLRLCVHMLACDMLAAMGIKVCKKWANESRATTRLHPDFACEKYANLCRSCKWQACKAAQERPSSLRR
jgi:Sec7 domain